MTESKVGGLVELPPCWTYLHPMRLYTDLQMREYATACVEATLSAHGQPVVGEALRDSFHDGVILALQVLNASGDCGSADYEELVRCCGLEALVSRAEAEDMMELSGLDEYTKELRETAAIGATQ